MAAVIGSEALQTVAASPAAAVESVEIFDDFRAVEHDWRALQSQGQTATPYQGFDFVNAWQDNVGVRLGAKPLPVIAYDAEKRPLMVLPLVARSLGPFRIACFPGGKHSNFNMPLWRREFAASATRDEMQNIVTLMAKRDPTLDALAMSQQPLQWNGTQNPFALLPHQPSVNECPLLTIDPKAPETWHSGGAFRRKLNGKERKLQALPGYRYLIARTAADANRLLDAFFAIKPLRMAEQKIKNVFAEAGTEAFIRHACLDGIAAGKPAIEIHGLECDAEVIAIFAGVGDGHRFSTMFNTYTMSDAARNSPGLVLIRNMIDHHAQHGATSFDFGVGTDDYKRQFCKERQPLFDSFLALSLGGQFAAKALSLETSVKRAIKQSPKAMGLLHTLRHRFG